MKVTIVAVSQLNRAATQQQRRPHLSDLRESGALEQDADWVIFPYREEYWDKGSTNVLQEMEIILAKHRNGATGISLATYNLATQEMSQQIN